MSVADTTKPTAWRIVGLGVLAGGASGLVGALLGFLFGLNRTPVVRDAPQRSLPNPNKDADNAGAAAKPKPAFEPSDVPENNNLMEISDWLAKIIVGAGLVGIKDLKAWVGEMGTALGVGAGLGYGYMAAAFGVTVIMYFFTLGFLFAYINTRTVIWLILVTTGRSVRDELWGHIKQQEERSDKLEENLINVKQNLTNVKENVDQVQQQVVEKVDTAAEENRIFSLLYSADPNAPALAAKYAQDFLTKPSNERNAKVWLYLACAYGQMHAVEADPAKKTELADKAYEALKKALELDRGLLPIATGLLYRDDPNHFAGDDDLVTLADQIRFQQLVNPGGMGQPVF